MERYIVTRHIEVRWEVEAKSHEEAKAIVDDMGESTGHYTEKTRVVQIGQDPQEAIIDKVFLNNFEKRNVKLRGII